jgi:hypothetical protein
MGERRLMHVSIVITVCKRHYHPQPHWLNVPNVGAHFNKVRPKGGWIDDVNKVRSDDKCEKGNAFTSTQRLAIKPGDPQQNKQRVTITICDKQFNFITSKNLWHRLEDVPTDKDLTKSKLGIKQFNVLTSMTVLHEVYREIPNLDQKATLIEYSSHIRNRIFLTMSAVL